MKEKKFVKKLIQGDYFGEVSLIFGSLRSSNVESINYCTLANLSSEYFNKMLRFSPEIQTSIKKRALNLYNDEWIQFKCILLEQIDYFYNISNQINKQQFYREI